MALFIPISGGFQNDLLDKTKRLTRQYRVMLDVEGEGSLEDVTSYVWGNIGITVAGQEKNNQGQAQPNSASINFTLETEWGLGSGNYKIIAGDIRERRVNIDVTVGSGNEWIQIFSGYTDRTGMAMTTTQIQRQEGTLTCNSLEVKLGMNVFPDPVGLVGFTIASDAFPDTSLVHYYTRLMGFSDSDVIAGEIPQIKNYVPVDAGKTPFQALQEMAQAWLALLTLRYDRKLIFNSKQATGYQYDPLEWVFDETNILRRVGGSGFADDYNRISHQFLIYEALDPGSLIHRNTTNFDADTGKISITIEDGKYWPLEDDPTSVAQLEYGSITGEAYPIGINIIPPTVGADEGGFDIESTNGLPTIISFDGDTLELPFDSEGYTPAILTDIGKLVQGTPDTGTLVWYDNATFKWYVKTTDPWDSNQAVTITGGIGAGNARVGLTVTRKNESNSEILLYNKTGGTIEITKLTLRGQPIRSPSQNKATSGDDTVAEKDQKTMDIIGGQFMTDMESAKISTDWWYQAAGHPRRLWNYESDWLPNIREGAIVSVDFAALGMEALVIVKSWRHTMVGAPGEWSTTLSVYEISPLAKTAAWWKFETIAGGILVDEKGTYNATLQNPGDSDTEPGQNGTALWLNKTGTTSGAVMLSNSEIDSFGPKITISIWAKSKSESGDSNARIITRDISDYFGIRVDQTQTTNQEYSIGKTGDTWLESLPVLTWNNFIIGLDLQNNKIYFWLNGESKGYKTWISEGTDRPLVIGCNTEDTIKLGTDPFNGVVDEMKIFNGIISNAEARAIHDTDVTAATKGSIEPPKSEGEGVTADIQIEINDRPPYGDLATIFPGYLLANWNLETLDALDSSPNKYDGIAGGNPSIVPGLVGNAMEFFGAEYVDVDAGSYAKSQASFTALVWFDTFASDQTIWDEGGNNFGWELAILGPDLIFGVRDAPTVKTVSTPTSGLSTGTWYRVTGTVDIPGDKMRLIIDTTEVGANDLVGITSYQGTDKATIGALYNQSPIDGTAPVPLGYARHFEGKIQYVTMYAKALTIIEIEQLQDNPGAIAINHNTDIQTVIYTDVAEGVDNPNTGLTTTPAVPSLIARTNGRAIILQRSIQNLFNGPYTVELQTADTEIPPTAPDWYSIGIITDTTWKGTQGGFTNWNSGSYVFEIDPLPIPEGLDVKKYWFRIRIIHTATGNTSAYSAELEVDINRFDSIEYAINSVRAKALSSEDMPNLFPEYLQAHWRLETLFAADNSRYGNDGTVGGSPVIVAGLAGPAMEFFGAEYVDVDAGSYAKPQASFTALVWFDTFASDQTVWVEGGSSAGWELAILGPDLIFGVRDATVKTVSTPTSGLSTGTWYRVTGTIDIPGDKMRLVVDETEVGTNDLVGISDYQGSDLATIGALYNQSPITGTAPVPGDYSRFFDGKIQHVSIYSKALNDIEIEQLQDNQGSYSIEHVATRNITLRVAALDNFGNPVADAKIEIFSQDGQGYILLDGDLIIATGTMTANRLRVNTLTVDRFLDTETLQALTARIGKVQTVDLEVTALPVPPQNRFALYSFDAISVAKVITDISGNGRDATAETGVVLAEGRVGNAVRMNGTGQYVTIFDNTNRAALMAGGKFSISFWVRSETTAGDSIARIITADASEYWALTVDQTQTGDQDSLWYYGPAVSETLIDFIPQGVDTHVVMTWNISANRARIYKNATLVSEKTSVAFLTTTRGVILGENLEETPSTGGPFVGLVDQLGFWTTELTIDEVASLYLNPGFDRTVISGDTIKTGQILSNATGVGGNPKTVLNLDDGEFYAGDGGFTFGTNTYIEWNGTSLNISGNVTISGSLSGVTGTFAGSLSAATGTFTGTLSAGTVIGSTIQSGCNIYGAANKIGIDAFGLYVASYDLTGSPITGDTRILFNNVMIRWQKYDGAVWDTKAEIELTTVLELGADDPIKLWTGFTAGTGSLDFGTLTNRFGDSYWDFVRTKSLLVDGTGSGGDAIREIQVANITISGNSESLAGTFLGSTNTIYAACNIRENSSTNRNAPKHRQATSGPNRLLYFWNTSATQLTINGIMEQAA